MASSKILAVWLCWCKVCYLNLFAFLSCKENKAEITNVDANIFRERHVFIKFYLNSTLIGQRLISLVAPKRAFFVSCSAGFVLLLRFFGIFSVLLLHLVCAAVTALVGHSNTEVSYGLHQRKTMILSLSRHYLAWSLSAVHSFPLSQGPMFVKGGSI